MASTPVGSNGLILEVLNRNNYKDWRPRMKTYLLSEDLWEVVEAIAEPAKLDDEYKTWTKKNAKALYAIQNSCGREMFSFIREIKTPKSAWEALEQECKVVQGYDENNADHVKIYKSFKESVSSDDWVKAKECLGEVDVRSVARAIDRTNDFGDIALHVAAREGHIDIVKALVVLMTKEDLKTKNANGFTALHIAVNEGHVQIVKELGPWMGEVKDGNGDTALHIAVKKAQLDIVKELVLLMSREELKINNDDGYTALHLAVNKGNVPIVKQFVTKEEGENNITDQDDRSLFTNSVMSGDWDNAIENLRELDDPCGAVTVVVDPRGKYRDTALHAAARKGGVHIKAWLSLLKEKQEVLELKTPQDFTTFGSGINLGVSEEVVMERAKHMVGQYKKILSNILEIQNAEGSTALHIAAYNGNVDIVKELVLLMRQEGLEIKDSEGDTALGCALYLPKDEDVMEVAKCMAEKNRTVFGFPYSRSGDIPVVWALRWSKWRLARYLNSVTPLNFLDGPNGSAVICYCLYISNEIDQAWDLLRCYPNLAMTIYERGITCPMLTLARMGYAFLSGTRLTHLQRWIYDRIHIREVDPVKIHDSSTNAAQSEDDHAQKRGCISLVMSLFRRFGKGLSKLCGIHRLYEMKATHECIFKILRCMGKATINDNLSEDQLDMVKKSIFKAIEQGHFEFVTQLCKENPQLLLDTYDENGRNIFHFAIEFRQREVYSLIYELKEEKRNDIGTDLVNSDNTMLHFAANLSSLPHFDHIQDASLQMQRELQWFEEVKSVVPSEMHEHRNRSNDMTARELFTKNHKKLMEDAENSIKGTATSCTVVGALIVTIMFSVAFTVPGENNDNTSLPLLLDQKLFKVFIVSDTISLVSSTTSVVTFLGILTSRYAEDDFLKSLPTKIMIGLITLFFAITTMMIAFSCALIIMLDGDAWIVSLSVLFASVPIISFVWLLFPLLVQILMSTYGPGIFDRKVKLDIKV